LDKQIEKKKRNREGEINNRSAENLPKTVGIYSRREGRRTTRSAVKLT
jgi:hypothetical protein